jgi:hypothetical protein
MAKNEVFKRMLRERYENDCCTLDLTESQWKNFKSTFGNISKIRDHIKDKSEHDRKFYLDEIQNFFDENPPIDAFEIIHRIWYIEGYNLQNPPPQAALNWYNEVNAINKEMFDFFSQVNYLYRATIPNTPSNTQQEIIAKTPQHIAVTSCDFKNIATLINWKGTIEEFIRQVQALEAANYIKIINGYITFIRPDGHEDVITLFFYWFRTDKIIPAKRNGNNMLPGKKISKTFKRLANNNVHDFTPERLGVVKIELIDDEIESRIKNFQEILK